MRLIVGGTAIRITHMGPDFLLIDAPSDLPPCEASILLRVDESESEWTVWLPVGVSKYSMRVAGAPAVALGPAHVLGFCFTTGPRPFGRGRGVLLFYRTPQ